MGANGRLSPINGRGIAGDFGKHRIILAVGNDGVDYVLLWTARKFTKDVDTLIFFEKMAKMVIVTVGDVIKECLAIPLEAFVAIVAITDAFPGLVGRIRELLAELKVRLHPESSIEKYKGDMIGGMLAALGEMHKENQETQAISHQALGISQKALGQVSVVNGRVDSVEDKIQELAAGAGPEHKLALVPFMASIGVTIPANAYMWTGMWAVNQAKKRFPDPEDKRGRIAKDAVVNSIPVNGYYRDVLVMIAFDFILEFQDGKGQWDGKQHPECKTWMARQRTKAQVEWQRRLNHSSWKPLVNETISRSATPDYPRGRCHFCPCQDGLIGHHAIYENLWREIPGVDVVPACLACHNKHHAPPIVADFNRG